MARRIVSASFGVAVIVAAQTTAPPAVQLLSAPAPLSQDDVEAVIVMTSTLMVGKSFFMYGGFGGGTITVGVGPRVRSVYYGDRITEWTGIPAKHCSGATAEGELVLDWSAERSGWRPSAKASSEPRVMDDLFGLWSLSPELVKDAGFREFDGLVLRGFRYAYDPPAGARFEATSQSVWFDPRTGLPVRYEIAIQGPEAMDYGYYLSYAPGWAMRPDSSIDRPDCISGAR